MASFEVSGGGRTETLKAVDSAAAAFAFGQMLLSMGNDAALSQGNPLDYLDTDHAFDIEVAVPGPAEDFPYGKHSTYYRFDYRFNTETELSSYCVTELSG